MLGGFATQVQTTVAILGSDRDVDSSPTLRNVFVEETITLGGRIGRLFQCKIERRELCPCSR